MIVLSNNSILHMMVSEDYASINSFIIIYSECILTKKIQTAEKTHKVKKYKSPYTTMLSHNINKPL